MSEQVSACTCRAIGAWVTGAAHARQGQPGQDALARLPEGGEGMPVCLAVADGHGSAASFRSAIGSRLAVEAATEVVYQLLEGYRHSPPSLLKRTAEERLPREIVRSWTERVRSHLLDQPFSQEELQALRERGGSGALQKVHDNPLVAYGSTVLVAGVVESSIVYLQLGDGDILVVDPGGEVFRPLPPDERVFAEETTSLCLPEAWADFRFAFQATSGRKPALILLSTDGYANCYATEADFLQVGQDLVELIRSFGLADVEQQLPNHLAEASRKYSGDDITLGIIWFPPTADGLA